MNKCSEVRIYKEDAQYKQDMHSVIKQDMHKIIKTESARETHRFVVIR